MTTTDARPNGRNTLAVAIIGVVVLAAIVLGGLVMGVRAVVDAIPTPGDIQAALAPAPYQEIGPVVISSIQDLAELTTVEMVEWTIVEKGTDEGWLQWARGDSVRLLAVASIGAGVDLSGLSVGDFEVSDQGAVTVTLPHAEIQYVDVDSEATEILERDTGIFTKGDADLETEARQVAESVLVDQATENGIVETAEENAVKAVESLLAGLGYTDTTVIFAG